LCAHETQDWLKCAKHSDYHNKALVSVKEIAANHEEESTSIVIHELLKLELYIQLLQRNKR